MNCVRASLRRMKNVLICLLILAGAFGAPGQEKPLTQAEYVKMLYSLPKNPGGQADVIESLRRRGIAFAVTDGIRGLTRSKGGNNEDLRRALEEAERRRNDPVGAQLPPEKELLALIEKSRTKTLAAVEEMPDFVVKQQIQRSAAYAGTNNFRNLDRLVVAVSYRASGQEDYRVLSLNGITQNNPESKRNYQEVGGTSSTGEFVTMLATIFRPESDTQFEPVQPM